jgi:hypothetical protein
MLAEFAKHSWVDEAEFTPEPSFAMMRVFCDFVGWRANDRAARHAEMNNPLPISSPTAEAHILCSVYARVRAGNSK